MHGRFSFWSWSALLALACGGTTDSGQEAVGGAMSGSGGETGTGGSGGYSATGGAWVIIDGGYVGTGGATSFDSRCPIKLPVAATGCAVEATTCTYSYFTSCLCATNTQYGCTQVDSSCTTATQAPSGAANVSIFPSGGAASFAAPAMGGASVGIPVQIVTGGSASAVALPPNHQCNCLNGVWVCLS